MSKRVETKKIGIRANKCLSKKNLLEKFLLEKTHLITFSSTLSSIVSLVHDLALHKLLYNILQRYNAQYFGSRFTAFVLLNIGLVAVDKCHVRVAFSKLVEQLLEPIVQSTLGHLVFVIVHYSSQWHFVCWVV
jgi:hypothetical protein